MWVIASVPGRGRRETRRLRAARRPPAGGGRPDRRARLRLLDRAGARRVRAAALARAARAGPARGGRRLPRLPLPRGRRPVGDGVPERGHRRDRLPARRRRGLRLAAVGAAGGGVSPASGGRERGRPTDGTGERPRPGRPRKGARTVAIVAVPLGLLVARHLWQG